VYYQIFCQALYTPHASLGLPLKNAVIPTSHKSKTGFGVENHFLKLQKCHKMSIHYGPVALPGHPRTSSEAQASGILAAKVWNARFLYSISILES